MAGSVDPTSSSSDPFDCALREAIRLRILPYRSLEDLFANQPSRARIWTCFSILLFTATMTIRLAALATGSSWHHYYLLVGYFFGHGGSQTFSVVAMLLTLSSVLQRKRRDS